MGRASNGKATIIIGPVPDTTTPAVTGATVTDDDDPARLVFIEATGR